MPGKRVFFLSSGRLTAYESKNGRLSRPLVFAASADGLTRFSEYLDAAAPTPVYLLVDVVEEEFREETIPHVYGADRQALIRTKKVRLFRDPTYSHAIFQERETDGRRDDRVLFTAVIRPELLSPWIGQIVRHKVPLAGIYSLPVLSRVLVKKLPMASDHALLVTLHSGGGLRQTFFYRGHLKISRLALVPRLKPANYASYVLGEVERIRRYLNSLRLLSRDSPLDVYIISHGNIFEDIRRQSTDSVTLRYHLLDSADVGRKLGLRDEPESAFTDGLFAHLLARFTPPDHYGRSQETRYFQLHRARLGLGWAAGLLLVGSLAWSGLTFVEGVIAKQETEAVRQQTGFYERRYQIASSHLPEVPAPPAELESAVKLVKVLRGYQTTPMDLLRVLGAQLAEFPKLKIEHIDWQTSATTEEADDSLAGRLRRRVGLGGQAPEAPAEDGSYFHVAVIRGHVEPFGGDFRVALEEVNGFVDSLARDPRMAQVRAVQLPLDLSSSQSLQGALDAARGTAAFTVRVAWRTGGDAAG